MLQLDTVVDDKFVISSRLGQGGMGAVYKAYQPDLNRFVALKMLASVFQKPNDEAVGRLQREAVVLSELRHKNIVGFFGWGTWKGQPYLFSEFVEGKSLDETIRKEGPLSLSRSVNLALQLASALKHAHAYGIIHRDLKPSNIMLTTEAGVDSIKVVDFGLAGLLPAFGRDLLRLTQDGYTVGTPIYMSPEMLLGEAIDHRSDIYALGIILHECLTGVAPFERSDYTETAAAHMFEAPAPLDSFKDFATQEGADSVQSIIYKAVAKTPGARYQSAEEAINELECVREGLPVEVGLRRSLAGQPRGGSTANSLFKKLLIPVIVIPLLSVAWLINFVMHKSSDSETGMHAAAEQLLLGRAYLKKLNYEPAAVHLKKAVTLFSQACADDDTLGTAEAELVSVLNQLRVPEQSFPLALSAERHLRVRARLPDFSNYYWIAIEGAAMSSMQLHKYEQAKEFLEKCLDYGKSRNRMRFLGYYYYQLAKCDQHLGNYHSALERTKQVYDCARIYDVKPAILSGCKEIENDCRARLK